VLAFTALAVVLSLTPLSSAFGQSSASLPSSGAVTTPGASSPFEGLGQFKAHRTRRGYVASGMVAIGFTLTIAFYASFFLQECHTCDHSDGKDLLVFVPVAGPLLTAANQSGLSAGEWTAFGVWSAIEAIGTTLLIIGFVGEDLPAHYSRDGRVIIGLAPAIVRQPGGQSPGLVLNGRF
jgi:hypothetical protein